ncbi:general substrate transporter [Kockovaella imperatae]|uniref:General substrate transporter n=1 Tax=Kockovaella imperatae TaxID=4999 RepID=A0A1Y1UHR4_9TREE|nr:general substrate transporter [Kockovaella imperatae]ORX37529.1 general substrate transporter [Kockovaella imperatae]
MNTTHNEKDHKDLEISHVDHVVPQTELGDKAADIGMALSKLRFDELSIPRTIWVFRRSVLVCLAVYTDYVCEGFELGAGGSIVANQGFIKQFATVKDQTGVRGLDPTWLSTWSALLNVGQIVTFTHISWVADRFGRKVSFYLAWVWLVVGCVFLNTAKTPSVWALAKLCNGAGIGVLQITCQVYAMEICPNRIRGGMITFQAVWSNIGGIVVAVMMQQLNQKHPDDYLLAMRILWAPIGLMIVFWAFVPESPWFHARRGDGEKALRSLRQLYGNVPGYDFEEEYGIIQRTIAHENLLLDNKPSFKDVFRGLNLRRTLTVMILAVCQQFAGLTIINTYSTYFFSLAGLADPFLGSVILSCCNLLAIMLWSAFTDKLGRRLIINYCETFVTIILLVVGGMYYTGATPGNGQTESTNAAASNGLLVICCFWTFAFQTIGMSYYLYSAELPTAVLRIRTGPVTFFTNSITGIASCYATPPLLLALNVRAGFVYGAFSVPCCIVMWFFIPETRARSAAEIDELYEKRIPAWRWSKTVTDAELQMRKAVAARSARVAVA